MTTNVLRTVASNWVLKGSFFWVNTKRKLESCKLDNLEEREKREGSKGRVVQRRQISKGNDRRRQRSTVWRDRFGGEIGSSLRSVKNLRYVRIPPLSLSLSLSHSCKALCKHLGL